MSRYDLFTTPFWKFEEKPVEGAYEWALSMKEKDPNGVRLSNYGGWQSHSYFSHMFPYGKHIASILSKYSYFQKFVTTNWWVNINQKGNLNMPHTHPGSELSGVWYITDNHGSLGFIDPSNHTRSSLYVTKILEKENIFIDCKAGELLIFPSDVRHMVRPHKLDTNRISVSFNMVIPDLGINS